MDRPSHANRSKYSIHGDRVELLLRDEQERRLLRKSPKTGIFAHQVEAAMRTMKFLQDPNKPNLALLIAPTGSGKTGILGLLPYLMRSRRTMVLTPSPTISRQIQEGVGYSSAKVAKDRNFFLKTRCCSNWTDEEVAGFLPSPFVVTTHEQIDDSNHELIIVNAQRLGGNSRVSVTRMYDEGVYERLRGFFRNIDLLIVDEAHHFPAPTWVAIKDAYEEFNPDGKIVFITATVERMFKGRPMRIYPKKHDAYVITKGELEGDVIRHVGMLELEHGSPDLALVRGDLVVTVMRTLEYQDRSENRFAHQALVTVQRKRDAEEMAHAFNERFPGSARAITGDALPDKDKLIKDFKEGIFRVAVVCRMLVEGFDNPSISVCAIFKQNHSRLFFEQFLGRCLRRRKFRDGPLDRTAAVFLSYKRFNQMQHYKAVFAEPVVAEEWSQDEDEFEEVDDVDLF